MVSKKFGPHPLRWKVPVALGAPHVALSRTLQKNDRATMGKK